MVRGGQFSTVNSVRILVARERRQEKREKEGAKQGKRREQAGPPAGF